MVKFQYKEYMNEILNDGPYSINNRPLILKPWTPEFDLNDEFLTEIPLWVSFPKLPMSYWSCNSLSRIASEIDIPLHADECTAKQSRISYARILIQDNVTKTLPDEICITDPYGKRFQQAVIYDWKPEFCEKCQKIGHIYLPQQKTEERQFEPPRRRRKARRAQHPNQQQGPEPNRFAQIWRAKEVGQHTKLNDTTELHMDGDNLFI
ncbi:uncharacterized protein [Nicotiana tomentosiformis]|uniref:uncharacterized protein n=1 Tax=Nicotiana tomentosiformis TaxID=4098 RepID=UPI00388C3F37